MARIVLSASQQEANQYAGGGTGYTDSEEYWCRKIVAVAAPIIRAAGHQVLTPNGGSYRANVAAGNAFTGTNGYYLAVHSNAAGAANYGKARGTVAFFKTGSTLGQAFAHKVYARVAAVSSASDRGVLATSSLGEVNRPIARYVALIEIDFHDNLLSAQEIRTKYTEYGKAIAQGVLDAAGVIATVGKKGVITDGANVAVKQYSTLGGATRGYLRAGMEVAILDRTATTIKVRRGSALNPLAVVGWVPVSRVRITG